MERALLAPLMLGGVEADQTGTPPEWLLEVVDTVLADLQQPHPIRLKLTYWQDHDGDWVIGPGLLVREDMDPAERLAAIALHFQDQVFDQTDEAWGEARPYCPGHPHPPDPRVIDGTAVWICPRDGHVLAPIGRLTEH